MATLQFHIYTYIVTDKLKTLLVQINNKRIWLNSMLYKSKHHQIHTTVTMK
jgi:hypothetical protein